jgi:O-antigen ligase
MPLGSGLGSFVRVYRLYESPDAVTNKYVIHAHNDYVEIALELGLAGVFLLLLFLEWWISQSIAVWRRGEDGPWARAASIASGTVLVHSLVDFPLRSAAIAACFAMCLALLAERQTLGRQEKSELRPTRHIVIV